MKVLGIDFGDARVGVATSDYGETLATAQGTIKVSGINDAVQKVCEKAIALGAEKLVIGLPKNMDGSLSYRAERTQRFAEMLKEATGLEYEFMDERLSTMEAYRYLNATEFNGKKRRNVIDTLSAQIILQSWLDSKKK
ncbi:MAG: Holliday junction resolvase RuvX [Clostridia bacterium]|jgi:putative Holliday junction resolvase|nr:Holliday junction resolvase RuvX [Clostridia bacterium]MBO7245290.1 Holliday junction resolvase RuvX [Clostridia bacterium]MBQ5842353.1 Holliday junction resolvase RuvX [Clostridia bacterium]